MQSNFVKKKILVKGRGARSFTFLLLLLSGEAWGFNFELEGYEFLMWDTRCQALYVSTGVGRRSEYARMVPPGVVHSYRSRDRLGEWHYCAGLIYMNRARISLPNSPELARNYDKAYGEMMFSIRKADVGSIDYARMKTSLGKLFGIGKNWAKMKVIFDEIISLHPQYERTYAEYAYFLDKKGDTKEAIEIIESIGEEILNRSAELNYFLGVYHFKLSDFDKARQYSNKAYTMGYPLNWLKEQLEKVSD